MTPPRAWPHAGVDKADRVFIEEIESGITRLVSVHQSSYPARIGNLRSARETDVDLMLSLGRPLLAYSGSVDVVKQQLADAAIPTATEATAGGAFYRDTARAAEKGSSTFSLYARGDRVRDLAYGRKASGLKPQNACFGPRPSGGRAVSSLEVRFPLQGSVFKWNGAASRFDVHYNYLASGTRVQVAAKTEAGVQLAAKNVVVLMSDRETVRMHRQTTPVDKTSTLGSGRAIVLRDGRAFAAKWTRPTLTDPIVLTTNEGKRFPLATGQTWTVLATQNREVLTSTSGTLHRAKVANRALPNWYLDLFPTPK